MERVHALEQKLEKLFKDLPALPKSTKEAIVGFWPYVVAVLGVLQLLAAWALWRLYTQSNALVDYANTFAGYLGTSVGYSTLEKTAIFIGITTLAVEAVLLLMAVKPLLNRERRGWDLLFIVALLQVIYAVVSVFMYGKGAGSLLFNLIGAAIGFYFLYQIKEFYTHKAATVTKKV